MFVNHARWSYIEVRNGVNQTLADLVAWSLHYAAMGLYPDRGFYNEEFEKNTYRAHLCGKPIAEDFKSLDILFWGRSKTCWIYFKSVLEPLNGDLFFVIALGQVNGILN